MAALSSVSSFQREVARIDVSSCPHVWIAGDALAFGKFPDAAALFDFTSETLRWESQERRDPTATVEKKRISKLSTAKRITERHEIETTDKIYEVGSATHALTTGLEIIENLVPGTLDKLSLEKKQSKRPVSRKLEDLYDVPKQRRYSEQISTGHFVATNNKGPEARGVLRRAAQIAGLSADQFVVRKRSAA